ncbi:hypothetical protein L484_021021 [Morus notabilis]|uniref:Uncharacterized protein n=1 Tax=Morus notabilis TaxID=981085 RepID=W9QQZ5_9ROSA|nr:hypothetical protein L484_021021 [Morus notabilis]
MLNFTAQGIKTPNWVTQQKFISNLTKKTLAYLAKHSHKNSDSSQRKHVSKLDWRKRSQPATWRARSGGKELAVGDSWDPLGQLARAEGRSRLAAQVRDPCGRVGRALKLRGGNTPVEARACWGRA